MDNVASGSHPQTEHETCGKWKAILGPAGHVRPAGKMYLLYFFVKNIILAINIRPALHTTICPRAYRKAGNENRNRNGKLKWKLLLSSV